MEKAKQFLVEVNVKGIDGNGVGKANWVVKEAEGGHDDNGDSVSVGSISEDSMNSVCSSSSSELAEEASSSTSYLSTSSSSSHSNGPLNELSELMINLPIKRGLSMFYQGKAQSFTSLARVQSIEDLPKKGAPYTRRMKSCKSYGGGLDSHKISYTPKATIAKKASRGSVASVLSKKGSFLGGFRPSIPVQKTS